MNRSKSYLFAWIVLCGILLMVLIGCNSKKDDASTSIDISHYHTATFEYVEDTGYKLITSEIGSLYTFIGLNIVPSEKAFSEDWIYRITFNPKKFMPNEEEFVILFASDCIWADGKCYVPADGVSYSDILAWAENKYLYFDYELMTE